MDLNNVFIDFSTSPYPMTLKDVEDMKRGRIKELQKIIKRINEMQSNKPQTGYFYKDTLYLSSEYQLFDFVDKLTEKAGYTDKIIFSIDEYDNNNDILINIFEFRSENQNEISKRLTKYEQLEQKKSSLEKELNDLLNN